MEVKKSVVRTTDLKAQFDTGDMKDAIVFYLKKNTKEFRNIPEENIKVEFEGDVAIVTATMDQDLSK